MPGALRFVEKLNPAEAGVVAEPGQGLAGEFPEDELVVGVDLAGIGNVDHASRRLLPALDAVGLDEDPPALVDAIAQRPQQAERVLDPVQDAEAEDQVEALLDPIELERVEPAILDLRSE